MSIYGINKNPTHRPLIRRGRSDVSRNIFHFSIVLSPRLGYLPSPLGVIFEVILGEGKITPQGES